MSFTMSMHHAAINGDLGQVQELLQDGANVETQDGMGTTSLMLASAYGKLHVVKFLVEEAGANLEAECFMGFTPLFFACSDGHLEVVQYLERSGANLEAKDKFGNTALTWAAREKNHPAVVQYLEERAVGRSIHASFPGEAPLPRFSHGPPFSAAIREFASVLEQWGQNVESILSKVLSTFEQWNKRRQNQSYLAQLKEIDEEIAKLETKKAAIQQKNQETISKATKKHGPPSALCCPITLQIMIGPVFIVEDGHTYERAAILEHWRTQESQGIPVTSPCTNQRILSKQLAQNVLARSQCCEWMEQHAD